MGFRVAWLRLLALLPPLLAASLCAQITESPHTVARGSFLLEMDAVSMSRDRDDAEVGKTTALGLGATLLTTGLSEVVDLQLGVTLFLRHEVETDGVGDTSSGLGDLYFRAKWKFWSDDTVGSALAVLPYLKVPSNTGGVGNDAVEGGVIFPWSMTLSKASTVGAMLQWDVVRGDPDTAYRSHWHVASFVEFKLASAISIYGEGSLLVASTGASDWAGTLGAGALWQVTKSIQLDYELQRGVNGRAIDWVHTLRLNWAW